MAGSNDTLFGLAAHLQTMENNLIDFIFHCALRLSTMTDSKVFVLMENPNDVSGGRRFCGSETLVEEFATHGLHPRTVNDVEMELNIDSPPIRQKQQQHQQHHQLQQQHHLPNKGILPSSGMKRRGATNAALVESDNSAKKVRPSEEASSAEEDTSSLALEYKTASLALEYKTEVVEFLIDSDSDEEISAENESSFANGSGSSSALIDSFDSSFLPSSSNIPIHDPSYSGDAEELPSRRIGLDVPNLAMKECVVTPKVDPTKAFVRGTDENKLLVSMCYDAGKAITLSNPHSVESPALECKTEVKNLINSDLDKKSSAGNESSFANAGGSSAFLDSFDSSLLLSSSDIPIHDPSSYSGGAEELPSRRIGLDVPNLAAKECCVITQKVDPTKAFVRGTDENKLLASICYDAGKAITLSNPHSMESPLFREHCKERIHAYVQHFPDFVNVEVTLEATALYYQKYNNRQKYTPESFMKMNARSGLKRALEAMRKIGNG